MKRSGPIQRREWLKRARPIARSGPIKSKPRSASDFARIYGSKARVQWVKSLPCCGCGASPSENAHTVTGGMGYKADASTIAPLCHRCHVRYDRHLEPFDVEPWRDAVKRCAVLTDTQWTRMGQTRRAS